MLSLVSTIVLGLLAAPSVLGQDTGVIPNPTSALPWFKRWQALEYNGAAGDADNGKVHWGVDGYGYLQFFYHSLPLGMKPFTIAPFTAPQASLNKILPNGQLELYNGVVTSVVDPGCPSSTTSAELQLYKISAGNFGIRVKCNSAGGSTFTSSIMSATMPTNMWPLNTITGLNFGIRGFNTTMTGAYTNTHQPSTYGAGVKIYALDGMYDPLTIYSDEVAAGVVGQELLGVAQPDPEVYSHAREMALLTKSNVFGLAQAATYQEVRITEMPNNFFYEKTFHRALQYVLNDGTGPKVVAFHGRFQNPSTARLNCAAEILFRRGITFIRAAGNTNTLVEDYNPYAFTVGAYCGGEPCPNMVRGDMLDIWAPGILFSYNTFGSSIASGFAGAVAAAYISKKPTLVGKPGLVYQTLRNTARTTLFPATHAYAVASANAANRVLYFNPNAAAATAEDSRTSLTTGPNYCLPVTGHTTSQLTVQTNALSAIAALISQLKA